MCKAGFSEGSRTTRSLTVCTTEAQYQLTWQSLKVALGLLPDLESNFGFKTFFIKFVLIPDSKLVVSPGPHLCWNDGPEVA